MTQSSKIILAIESAISGGSLAILSSGDVIGEISGGSAVSRAEDLLPNIAQLLKETETAKERIDAVAVSLGPGSYTGLRIGIATVLGFCRGLGIAHVGVDLFQAIDSTFGQGEYSIALPMGKSDVCLWIGPDSQPKVLSRSEIMSAVKVSPAKKYLIHPQLSALFEPQKIYTVDIGTNMARYVGLTARNLPESPALKPIYLKNPRFG